MHERLPCTDHGYAIVGVLVMLDIAYFIAKYAGLI